MLCINDIITIIINRTPLGFLMGELVVIVVVCRRYHFTSSIFLKFGYVLQMGIKFWKVEQKVAPKIWVMGFGTPFGLFLGDTHDFQTPWNVYFSPKIKIL